MTESADHVASRFLRLEPICEQFEAVWLEALSGNSDRPRIEQFISDSSDEDRAILLRELLAVEIDFRQQAGETPSPDDYDGRLSDEADHAVLLQAFGPEAADPVATQPGRIGPIEPAVPLAPAADTDAVAGPSQDTSLRDQPTLPPASPASTVAEPPASDTADQPALDQFEIPGYEILSELGRGGMGVVYRARDSRLKRDVAIKMILAGSHAGPEQLARFQREAEAVAQLQHPNIVQIHEVGEHKGLPYLSLEYVPGGSLDEKTSNQPQPPKDAAQLVETLSRAVHAAHQGSIIHRDLKPANILLTSEGTPKITDFGLAKRLEGDSIATKSGSLIGTPSYMAPEQAGDKHGKIGPPTDVYALGAILYYLLTGRPPFQSVNPLDTVLQVLESDPVPPGQLIAGVDRDLETVTLKCLEKDPQRRYKTASELAEDLTHWLDGEPIEARPVTWMERSWRWCKRKPAVAALWSTAVLLLLTLGIGGLSLAFLESAHAREQTHLRETADRSADNEKKARADAETARQDEATARNQAEKNFEAAQQTVDEFLTEVSQSDLLNEPQMEPLRRQLLEKARTYYQKFIQQQTDDPKLKRKLGDAHVRLGNILRQLGEHEAAIAEVRQAIGIRQQLVKEHPDVPEYANRLAISYNNLGVLLRSTGKSQEAATAYGKAREIRERLVKEHPDVPVYANGLAASYNNLGILLGSTGQSDEAATAYGKASEIRERLFKEHPDVPEYANDLAMSYNNLGNLLQSTGTSQEAATAYGKAREIRERLVKEHPDVPEYASGLAGLYSNLGVLLRSTGKSQEAATAYGKAIAIYEPLVKEHSDVPAYANDLASSYFNLGGFLQITGKSEAAATAYGKAREIFERLVKEHPGVPKYANDLASAYNNLGVLLDDLGKSQAAATAYGKAREIRERLVKEHPDVPKYANDLASAYNNLGVLLRSTGKSQEAATAYGKASEIYKRLVKEHPDVPEYVNNLARSYLNSGLLEQGRRRYGKAIAHFERSLKLLRSLKKDGQLARRLARAIPHAEQQVAICQRAERAIEELSYALAQPAEQAAGLLSIRGSALAERGHHAGAAESGEKLAGLVPPKDQPSAKATNLYNAACLLSLSSSAAAGDKKLPEPKRKELAERYAVRAVELLGQARLAGFFKNPKNIAHLTKDSDLGALRTRADYKKFLHELQSTPQPQPN